MRVSHTVTAHFDHENPLGVAGLVPAVALAERDRASDHRRTYAADLDDPASLDRGAGLPGAATRPDAGVVAVAALTVASSGRVRHGWAALRSPG